MDLQTYLRIKKASTLSDDIFGTITNHALLNTAMSLGSSSAPYDEGARMFANMAIAAPAIQGLNSIAGISGALSNVTKKDIEKINETPFKAFIPGVASNRAGKKNRYAENMLGDKKNNISLYDTIGRDAAIPIGMLGGALGGKLLGKNPFLGAGYGLTTGFALHHLGSLAGAAQRPDKENRIKHFKDNSSKIKALLIPGYGSYQSARNGVMADKLSRLYD